jgi:hypothetical protein
MYMILEALYYSCCFGWKKTREEEKNLKTNQRRHTRFDGRRIRPSEELLIQTH